MFLSICEEMLLPVEQRTFSSQGLPGLFVVLALTGAYFFGFFSLDFLLGRSSFWLAENQDITQYRAGFNAFFAEPWHWPLLRIDSLNYPRGTLVTFVDGIPLFSLLLKVLVPKSFFPFNPFGWWVGLCYLLQGVGAWWILREARLRSWTALAGLTLLLLMSPALTFRLGHTSLMAHWLILFGFALYIRSGRLKRPSMMGWSLLLLGAFYSNIYLCAMCFVLFCADLLRFWKALSLGRLFLFGAFPFLLIFSTALVTMYPLPPGSGAGGGGFGFYSMNLIAPFSGGHFLPCSLPLGTAGQGEGYNYLGLGVLLLVLGAGIFRLRKDRGFFFRHGVLLFFLWVAFLYALSHKIYFGDLLLWHYPFPSFLEPVTGAFRVSGRFFWIVGYGAVLFGVLTLGRLLSKSLFALLMGACLFLQWADLEPVRNHLYSMVHRPATEHMNYSSWDAFLGEHVEVLFFFPDFLRSKNPSFDSLLPAMLYASERKLNITTGYIARYQPLDLDPATAVAGSDPARTAYVFVREEFPHLEQVRSFFDPGLRLEWAELDFAWVVRGFPEEQGGVAP